jgi:TonB family protein
MKIIMSLIGAGMIACASITAAQEVAQVVSPGVNAQGQQQVPDNVLVDVQPTVIKRVEPVYPRDALAKGAEGKMWLKILVDTAGHPAQVEVLKSENEYFDQASITAARQWLFTPALKNNKPVAVWITLPFKFKLADKDGGDRSQRSKHQGAQLGGELMKKVEMVFAGDASARSLINPEACLVDGARFVSLNEALFGKEKGKCFAGESKRQRSFTKITIAEDGSTATVVLKTENAGRSETRWHTVGWAKEKEGDWKITHWHTSR